MLDKSKKIFHGTINIGNIGYYLSQYQKEKGYKSDFITFSRSKFFENKHFFIPLGSYYKWTRRTIRLIVFLRCLLKYDIFHFYFGHTFFKSNIDLPVLKFFGKKMIMNYAGSEIRLIKKVKETNPYYPLLEIGLDDPKFDDQKESKMRYHNKWIHKFITARGGIPSVLSIIPENKVISNIWVYSPMNISNGYLPAYTTPKKPTIVHAPSEQKIKGTKYVHKAIENLRQKNLEFEYFEFTNIPNTEVQKFLQNKADILIDQLLIGGFGTVAIEAMYYGLPVCAYIDEEIHKECCPDLPIVRTNINTLEEKLEWLIQHPKERVKIGREGRKFVEKYCDEEKINQQVLELYASLYN